MKVLKYLLIGLGAIIALVLIVAVFMPSDYVIERSVQINASDSTVFTFTANHNNRKLWDPWLEMEPGAQVTLSGTAGQVGSTWEWRGETIGSGTMKIIEINPYSMIRSEIFFGGEDEPGIINWKFTANDGGTKVSWSIEGPLEYPIGRLIGPLMEKMVTESFDKGLVNLKLVLENQ